MNNIAGIYHDHRIGFDEMMNGRCFTTTITVDC